jgi:hypothetical protein
MNFEGIVAGFVTFLIIGLFHPLVIKAEYYWGRKACWSFLFVGILSIVASVAVSNLLISILLGILGFSCLWSIKEVIDQGKRVKEGRFPKNPKRSKPLEP